VSGDRTVRPVTAEVFRFVTEEIRQVGVHLLGGRLYETMLYWETADQEIERLRAGVYPVLVGGAFRSCLSASARWSSNSSRPAPSARRSSTSAIACGAIARRTST